MIKDFSQSDFWFWEFNVNLLKFLYEAVYESEDEVHLGFMILMLCIVNLVDDSHSFLL